MFDHDIDESLKHYIVDPDDIRSASLSHFSENCQEAVTVKNATNSVHSKLSKYADNSGFGDKPQKNVTVSKETIQEILPPSFWRFYCYILTSLIPDWVLMKSGITSPAGREAWRQKVGWLSIIMYLSLITAYFAVQLQYDFCGGSGSTIHWSEIPEKMIIVHGRVYNITDFRHQVSSQDNSFTDFLPGNEIIDGSLLFQNVNSQCKGFLDPSPDSNIFQDENKNVPWYFPCRLLNHQNNLVEQPNIYVHPARFINRTFSAFSSVDVAARRNYSFSLSSDHVKPMSKSETYKITLANWKSSLMTNFPEYGCHLSGRSRDYLYNLSPYKIVYYTWDDIMGNQDFAVYAGNVISLKRLSYLSESDWVIHPLLRYMRDSRDHVPEMTNFLAKNSTTKRIGRCLIEIAKVGVIDSETVGCVISKTVLYSALALIFLLVASKLVFALFFEWFLAWKGTSKEISQSPKKNEFQLAKSDSFPLICLITVYRERKEGIQLCIEKLAETLYPAEDMVIIVVCDGMVSSESDKPMSYEYVVELLAPSSGSDKIDIVENVTYVSTGRGNQRLNRANIYSGLYKFNKNTRRLGIICIVKKGQAHETGKKGNRGKRDSQVIVMSFFQHVFFHDRMTDLENELYLALEKVSKHDPHSFEAVLMIDADTVVHPECLQAMTHCLQKDPFIVGLCGETTIANKKDSWVTMIQVFEYFISHHFNKSFESVFGCVTCLPGCFCMYRVKVEKDCSGYWLPILANPDIVSRYSVNIVDSLHQKNLLLLGEDRYLSTLILKAFPLRKLIFLPNAKCQTVVPSDFTVLMDQRRRWINSTIHNLVELVVVQNLCGVFCISLQFVIMAELLGTLTLPIAMILTFYLGISSTYKRPVPWMPLVLLLCIQGMPGLLIFSAGHKWSWLIWMLIYFVSLPIWNFVIPINACKLQCRITLTAIVF